MSTEMTPEPVEVPAPVLSGDSEFDRVAQVKREDKLSDSSLEAAYCLPELVKHIISNGYKTVALQFPDELIPDSAQVARLMRTSLIEQSDTPASVYILADTSYSPCCVDEIAAQHVAADFVVHFGNTCLNPVRTFPVAYVLSDGIKKPSMSTIEQMFRDQFDTTDRILLVSDAQYSAILYELYNSVKEDYNVVLTVLDAEEGTLLLPPSPDIDNATEKLDGVKRRHPPLDGQLSDYKAFILTSAEPSPSLVLHLSTLVESVTLLQFTHNGPIVSQPRTALQKRYRLVNMARASATIGILVNTLSLRGTMEVLKTVQQWITKSGKKYYTFVVGKPNVPKLANFDVVDMWVVLGCPLGGLMVNSEDYYKPIITPYELNLALQHEISWTGKWLIDFEAALKLSLSDDDGSSDHQGADDSDSEPEFDPVTGTYVSTSRPLRRLKHVNVEPDEPGSSGSGKELAERMSSQMVIRGTVSTAAEHLQSKLSWRGLGTDYDDEEVDEEGAEVEKGRGGIARGYSVHDHNRT
uniref:2-(3-amino-3-carboxypropyl)histidine synthase subunit 2 n=1 Tax=Blastobotrys adeninivorans TaxID=409370 RepID=A0A060TBB6_BLAAD